MSRVLAVTLRHSARFVSFSSYIPFTKSPRQTWRVRSYCSSYQKSNDYEVKVDKAKLKEKLTPVQYHVTQERGTERAFSGEYFDLKDDGHYHCIVCDAILFRSDEKFDSGCGWPSFYEMADKGSVKMRPDHSYGMTRTETVCAKCGAHLGHLFDDGPMPTGQRYCINSASLKFQGKPKGK